MADLVTTTHADGISTIVMDDGKVNVFSIPLLETLHAAFDEVEQQGTVVVLTGRPYSSAAPMVAMATISAEAPCA